MSQFMALSEEQTFDRFGLSCIPFTLKEQIDRAMGMNINRVKLENIITWKGRDHSFP